VIVHCSAGIGRTGVLILMETAECLIEANQPVYPLDIVNKMREQRPLMIQTSVSYITLLTEARICDIFLTSLSCDLISESI
jgi:protein tyrosine phosphatase